MLPQLTLARNLWWNVGQSWVDRLRYSRHRVFGSRDRLFQISVKWTEEGGAGWGWSTVQSNNEQIMKVWVTGPQHSHMPSNIAISEADACVDEQIAVFLFLCVFYADWIILKVSFWWQSYLWMNVSSLGWLYWRQFERCWWMSWLPPFNAILSQFILIKDWLQLLIRSRVFSLKQQPAVLCAYQARLSRARMLGWRSVDSKDARCFEGSAPQTVMVSRPWVQELRWWPLEVSMWQHHSTIRSVINISNLNQLIHYVKYI